MTKKLMTHLYFGDPNEAFSFKLAKTLAANGADILEIGIPYSDPVADGPVFQRACHRALANGTTPATVLAGIRKLRQQGLTHPIYVTSYFGPVFKMGIQKFMQQVAAVGVHGVIIPDILLEEQQQLLHFSKKYHLNIVQFATPYSTNTRIKTMVRQTEGFLYCVSVPGVTGSRNQVAQQTLEVVQKVSRVKQAMNSLIPIFVGFGISKPAQIRQILKAGADGVIVGSAIGNLYQKNSRNPDKALSKIASFTHQLKASTNV